MSAPTLRAAVAGATGYAGAELVRLLHNHPHASLRLITSGTRAGQELAEIYPSLHGIYGGELVDIAELDPAAVDVVFLALPHGASMEFVREHADAPFTTIDLSGDYRLSGPGVYEEWYGQAHVHAAGFEHAVYGLSEWSREELPGARLVANPGCYPTAVALALAPLLAEGWVEPSGIVVDAKSGVTGAGASAKPGTHFPLVNDNFHAYGLLRHRHTVEMQEALGRASGGPVELLFTPHLLPVNRGILATIYARPTASLRGDDLAALFRERYAGCPFVQWVDEPPGIQQVRGSNQCHLHARFDERTGTVLLLSAIDNLVKGAAGQAVQNMNLCFGLPEESGLDAIPLMP